MAACDVNSITRDAGCFFCLPPGYYYPIKLALLCRWWKLLNPAADCSVNALMADAKCFACLTPGEMVPLKLALLCRILSPGASIPSAPTNLTLVAFSESTVEMSFTFGPPDPLVDFIVTCWRDAVGGPEMATSPQTFPASARDVIFDNGSPFPAGHTYFFAIRANNGGGNISGYSNSISVAY